MGTVGSCPLVKNCHFKRNMDFNEVKEGLISGKFILIDVRNTEEVKECGKIPKSHLIPLPEMNAAFQMDDASFKAKYGFEKPTKGAPIVTSCHIGGRANKAKQGLEEQGYTDVKVYSGSFTDWKASGGEIEN